MFNLRIAGCALVVATLMIMTACSVGPDYVRPTVETPPIFKEISGWKVAQPRDDAGKGPWWEIFNDPQLNALEQRVNISNQNVAVAEAQFREARALAKVHRVGSSAQ